MTRLVLLPVGLDTAVEAAGASKTLAVRVRPSDLFHASGNWPASSSHAERRMLADGALQNAEDGRARFLRDSGEESTADDRAYMHKVRSSCKEDFRFRGLPSHFRFVLRDRANGAVLDSKDGLGLEQSLASVWTPETTEDDLLWSFDLEAAISAGLAVRFPLVGELEAAVSSSGVDIEVVGVSDAGLTPRRLLERALLVARYSTGANLVANRADAVGRPRASLATGAGRSAHRAFDDILGTAVGRFLGGAETELRDGSHLDGLSRFDLKESPLPGLAVDDKVLGILPMAHRNLDDVPDGGELKPVADAWSSSAGEFSADVGGLLAAAARQDLEELDMGADARIGAFGWVSNFWWTARDRTVSFAAFPSPELARGAAEFGRLAFSDPLDSADIADVMRFYEDLAVFGSSDAVFTNWLLQGIGLDHPAISGAHLQYTAGAVATLATTYPGSEPGMIDHRTLKSQAVAGDLTGRARNVGLAISRFVRKLNMACASSAHVALNAADLTGAISDIDPAGRAAPSALKPDTVIRSADDVSVVVQLPAVTGLQPWSDLDVASAAPSLGALATSLVPSVSVKRSGGASPVGLDELAVSVLALAQRDDGGRRELLRAAVRAAGLGDATASPLQNPVSTGRALDRVRDLLSGERAGDDDSDASALGATAAQLRGWLTRIDEALEDADDNLLELLCSQLRLRADAGRDAARSEISRRLEARARPDLTRRDLVTLAGGALLPIFEGQPDWPREPGERSDEYFEAVARPNLVAPLHQLEVTDSAVRALAQLVADVEGFTLAPALVSESKTADPESAADDPQLRRVRYVAAMAEPSGDSIRITHHPSIHLAHGSGYAGLAVIDLTLHEQPDAPHAVIVAPMPVAGEWGTDDAADLVHAALLSTKARPRPGGLGREIDALDLLAEQHHAGRFQARNGGVPTMAAVTVETIKPRAVSGGHEQTEARASLDPSNPVPLEAMIEAEPESADRDPFALFDADGSATNSFVWADDDVFSTWSPGTLSYDATVWVGGEDASAVGLHVDDHRGGPLAWYSFRAGDSDLSAIPADSASVTLASLAPSSPHRSPLGDSAGTSDQGPALRAVAIRHAGDSLVGRYRVPTGAFHRVTQVRVNDGFGWIEAEASTDLSGWFATPGGLIWTPSILAQRPSMVLEKIEVRPRRMTDTGIVEGTVAQVHHRGPVSSQARLDERPPEPVADDVDFIFDPAPKELPSENMWLLATVVSTPDGTGVVVPTGMKLVDVPATTRFTLVDELRGEEVLPERVADRPFALVRKREAVRDVSGRIFVWTSRNFAHVQHTALLDIEDRIVRVIARPEG